MSSPPVVIADADAIVAQTDQDDPHHQAAMTISITLVQINAQVIYPATAIAEANAHIQRVLGSTAAAYGTAQVFINTSVHVSEVNQQTLTQAMGYFSPETSKKNTLFDCIVAATAKQLNADYIFSWDSFYKKQGFKLTDELIKKPEAVTAITEVVENKEHGANEQPKNDEETT